MKKLLLIILLLLPTIFFGQSDKEIKSVIDGLIKRPATKAMDNIQVSNSFVVYLDTTDYSIVFTDKVIKDIGIIKIKPIASGVKDESLFRFNKTFVVDLSSERDISFLYDNSHVILIEVNSTVIPAQDKHKYITGSLFHNPDSIAIPNDTYWEHAIGSGSYVWWLNNGADVMGGQLGVDCDALRAWAIEKGDSLVKIAILDSGLGNYQSGAYEAHPDMIANIDTNLTWNVITDNRFTDNTNSSHGVECGSICGAKNNNGMWVNSLSGGFDGEHNGITLIDIDISYIASGGAMTSDVATGIIKAVNYGASVINISFIQFSVPRTDLIIASYYAKIYGGGTASKGTIICWAAGNDVDTYYPFLNDLKNAYLSYNLDNVLLIGGISYDATNKYRYAEKVDYYGPAYHGACAYLLDAWAYSDFSGTSCATPSTCAVIGIIISYTYNLNLSYTEILRLLDAGSFSVLDYNPTKDSTEFNGKVPNALGSLREAWKLYHPSKSLLK